MCGLATVAFGLFCGSFFGINMQEWFPSVKFFNFQGQFFSIALVIGIVQILFGMSLNIWMTVRNFGLSRALGQLGWFIMLVSCCLAVGLPMAGSPSPGIHLRIGGLLRGAGRRGRADVVAERSETQPAHQSRARGCGTCIIMSRDCSATCSPTSVCSPSDFRRRAGAGVHNAAGGFVPRGLGKSVERLR